MCKFLGYKQKDIVVELTDFLEDIKEASNNLVSNILANYKNILVNISSVGNIFDLCQTYKI